MFYVDTARNKFGGMIMCHMIADSRAELFERASQLGLKRSWFQDKSVPHFDICLSKRKEALRIGAVELERKEFAELIKKLRET